MEFDHESHRQAIDANIKELDESVAAQYDSGDATRAMLTLFAKTLLGLDRSSCRTEEGGEVVGDPGLDSLGIHESVLPDPKIYHNNFPNSLFKQGAQILDFACGTGIVTEKLVPYTRGGAIVGIDVNPAFLQRFHRRAFEHYDHVPIEGFEVDIMDPSRATELNERFGHRFDLVYSTLSYHHIGNYEEVTARLCDFLAPGGHLVIIDFYNEDVESPAIASEAVRHMGGLKKDALEKVLVEKCDLENVVVAQQFRIRMWADEGFIRQHCTEATTKAMERGELPVKGPGPVYLVEMATIMARGEKRGNPLK